MNALSAELLTELADHVEAWPSTPTSRRSCWPATTGSSPPGPRSARSRRDADRLLGTFRRAFDGLAAIPRPVIAAISGFALGGGLEAALACDLRLAAENARLGVPEILLGVFPGAGGTQRLARLIGPAKAKELIWTGRQVRADGGAGAWASSTGSCPARATSTPPWSGPARSPPAPWWPWAWRSGPSTAASTVSLADGLDLERTLFDQVLDTEDAATGIKSFFENGPGKATFSR